ncbi:hypothetical protein NDU88_005883 [Pleurodeles waltl]|uniref:Uncharacterized protein n=1 Tax=Pleurodeles waltl TaxID=8319 RepID=A0AAV7WWI5_PLEWA|nr:hypothetical protein NDU88_005883 [Pleurodeles waltl]
MPPRHCFLLCRVPASLAAPQAPCGPRGLMISPVGPGQCPIQDPCPSIWDSAAGALEYAPDSIAGLPTSPYLDS